MPSPCCLIFQIRTRVPGSTTLWCGTTECQHDPAHDDKAMPSPSLYEFHRTGPSSVQLKGRILSYDGGERYIFADASRRLPVRISPEHFPSGRNVSTEQNEQAKNDAIGQFKDLTLVPETRKRKTPVKLRTKGRLKNVNEWSTA